MDFKKGDKVTTGGGIRGIVVGTTDRRLRSVLIETESAAGWLGVLADGYAREIGVDPKKKYWWGGIEDTKLIENKKAGTV